MTELPADRKEIHEAFISASKKHVLMITNHGVHEWEVVPGLPDTGGQNVFVNQFSQALTKFGFKITIVNRGGYPHPVSGEWQRGLKYMDENQRILYLEDGRSEFVRKEDMHEQILALVEALADFLLAEGVEVDLIISHYWDAAQIGVLYNKLRERPVKHIWVPHSLGLLKKRNVDPERWDELRIDERIETEMDLMEDLDGIAATSSKIRQTLNEDYGYSQPDLFLPPCIDTERYYPRQTPDDHQIWQFLSRHSGMPPGEVRKRKIITEISRTDTTKRKDILIEAFARAQKRYPNSFLIVSIDEKNASLARELKDLIVERGIQKNTAVVGSIWEILPVIYAITDIYCTPSIMEGFGMSAQEAAATSVPVVASNLVPYVVEYLLGDKVNEYDPGAGTSSPVRQGEGAIVVQADDIAGFAFALEMLLADESLRGEMGRNAYRITIPYFTWENMVQVFLEAIGEHV